MNLIRKFVSALETVGAELRLLRDSIENQAETRRTDNELLNQEPPPAAEVRAEVRFPDALETERRTDKATEHSLQRANVVVTGLAFIAAAIYAAIAGCQLKEMRRVTAATETAANAAKKSADTAQQVFDLTYRPRVKVVGVTPNQENRNGVVTTILNDGRLTARVDVPNVGMFPAVNVRFFRYDVVGLRDAITQHPGTYVELLGEPKVIAPKSEGGGSSELTIAGEHRLTPQELQGLKSGSFYAIFSLMVVYQSELGDRIYHAEYCDLFTLKPYNDICPWSVKND